MFHLCTWKSSELTLISRRRNGASRILWARRAGKGGYIHQGFRELKLLLEVKSVSFLETYLESTTQ
jgi:hypothetical protein